MVDDVNRVPTSLDEIEFEICENDVRKKITSVARGASEKRISKMNLNKNMGLSFYERSIDGSRMFWTKYWRCKLH